MLKARRINRESEKSITQGMPRGKEQKLHLIAKRPKQCCQVGFCSAWGSEPRPLLASKMLLFLRVASAGFCRGWFKPAEAKGEGSFSHANRGPGSWVWFFLFPSVLFALVLQGQCPRESGVSLLTATSSVGSSGSPRLFSCCFTGLRHAALRVGFGLQRLSLGDKWARGKERGLIREPSFQSKQLFGPQADP